MIWRSVRWRSIACAIALSTIAAANAFGQSNAPTPSLAQTQARAEQAIETLEKKWRADRASVSVAEMHTATSRIWASGDKLLILRLQNLWISVALRDRDVPREIGGRLIAFLLNTMVDGALSENAAWSAVALGQAYLKDAERLREGAHYALVNAIAISEALERAGKGTAELTEIRARASALLGQSNLQSERPGQAIYHLTMAQSLAQAANFPPATLAGVNQLLELAQEAHAEKQATVVDRPCGPSELVDEALAQGCMNLADRAWATGDKVRVEQLMAGMTSEVLCGSLQAGAMEAFRHLHFARMLLHGPDSDTLSVTVCGLGGRLNGEGYAPYAAIVAWPLIHHHILMNVFEQRTANVAAHTARRLARGYNDSLAWLAHEAAIAYVYSADKATDNPNELIKRRRAFLTPTIAFDMAYLAEQNDWLAIRDRYLRVGVEAVERSDPAQIEAIYDALGEFFDKSYGLKIPTPVAAMEFFSRIAQRLPADHEYHKMTVSLWPRLEQLYRGDDARAGRVVADNLSRYRQLPNADPYVITLLLQAYADSTSQTEPDKASASRREALEIVSRVAGREDLRVELLFEVERDRRLMGDAAGAIIYFDQAVALRRTTPKLDTRTAARVDMRLAVRMFNAGDKTGAIALAEAAFNAVIDATKAPLQHWQRTTSAKSLAEILAANGDLARVRAIYEEHVFPHTDNAIAAGEAVPIDTRLDLAVLEAVYGPTAETVNTIRDLMKAGQQRAGSAKEIQERGWRSLAIAHLGLKDGPAALDAARRAFALKPAMTSQVRDEAADRRLSETFVSAAWSADATRTSTR